ncbi:phage baseplate assembly protein V [Microbacterium sp. B2969]|uniref:Phage baseplate assembly protein V n=1 Tax=Microbacterium alkaliflavum TaxID=3248839 RepID=A0ABW7QAL3_9MICO
MGLPEPSDGQGPRFFGVYPALVTKITDDPANLGRVQVRYPSLGTDGDRDVRGWATLCSPYADKDQGLQIMPEVDSEVIVAFEAGDFRRGYIVGAAWNGKAGQPESPAAPNNIRVLRTRENSRLEFDDTVGSPKISLTTKTGHKVVLKESPQEITITHINGCTITLNSSGGIDITANTSVTVTAPSLSVNAATSTFSGAITCQTFTANVSVSSPLYSSGVGNLW